jgi:hypothetical protein
VCGPFTFAHREGRTGFEYLDRARRRYLHFRIERVDYWRPYAKLYHGGYDPLIYREWGPFVLIHAA